MTLLFSMQGKRKCIKDAAHILRVLSDLLGHENQEVGVLYNCECLSKLSAMQGLKNLHLCGLFI